MIQNSIFYVVCCCSDCKESGNIKKNFNKCPECRKSLTQVTLQVLNQYFCIRGQLCKDAECRLLHANKKHKSPPYISPCNHGINCTKAECLFLHPSIKCNSWLVTSSV